MIYLFKYLNIFGSSIDDKELITKKILTNQLILDKTNEILKIFESLKETVDKKLGTSDPKIIILDHKIPSENNNSVRSYR